MRLRAALFAMAGVILGLIVAGDVQVPIGPFTPTLLVRHPRTVRPSCGRAPLGTIRIDSHDAPFVIVAEVDELRLEEAEAIARDPALLEEFESQFVDDARSGLRALVIRALLVATFGGLLGALANALAWRSLLVGALAGSRLVAGAGRHGG